MTILCIVFLLCIFYFNNIKIPCLFHKFTGFYCPGCGITRSLISLFRLDFYQSFRYNPLIFILYPFFIPYTFYKIWVWLFDKDDKISNVVPNFIWIILVILFVLFGILRNIDIFNFLAPTLIK